METSSPSSTGSSNAYVLLFGLIMLVGLLLLAWLGQPPRMSAIGEPLPRLDLQPLLHTEHPLSKDDLQGKVVVLHFWGTWCPPCMKEFPEFAKLAAEFESDSQVVIASVSCSPGAEYDLEKLRAQTDAFLTSYPNLIPTYSDPAAMTREQLALLLPNGSLGYPTTLLVGRDGRIINVLEGYYPGDMKKLAGQIKAHLQ